MKKIIVFVVVLLATPLILCAGSRDIPVTSAVLDPLALDLRSRLQTDGGWENIEGSPWWISGKVPAFDCSQGLHVLILQPGEDVFLYRPDESMLRMVLDHADDPRPDVYAGSGTGLTLRVAPLARKKGEDVSGRSLLYRFSRESQRVIRVVLPEDAGCTTRLALFFSRMTPPKLPELYRECAPVCGDPVVMKEDGRPGSRDFQRFARGKATWFDITGPVRLDLEHYIILSGQESSRIIPYEWDCSLDTTALEPLRFVTGPLSSKIMRIQDLPRALGRREHGYIFVPEGRHRVGITPSRDMLVRMRVHDGGEFLFPKLNFMKYLQPADPTRCDPLKIRSRALVLAEDNSRREGGLQAAAMMRQVAEVRSDVPVLASLARTDESRFTFFQDIFPQGNGRSRQVCFLTPMPDFPKHKDRQLVVHARQWRSLVKTLGRARFFSLPPNGTWSRFAVPERPAPSTVRVAVVLPQANAAMDVRIGDGDPVRFLVRPGEYLFHEDVSPVPDTAQAGLFLLRERFGKLDTSTMGGPFSTVESNAPLENVGWVDLELPASAHTVDVRVQGGQVLETALEYRTSRPFALDESLYAFLINQRGGNPLDLFLGELAAAGSIPPRLASHWQPLIRFLKARNTLFRSAVDQKWEPSCLRPLAGMHGIRDIGQVEDLARAAQKAGDYPGALEYWAAITRLAGGESRTRALREQDRCLEVLGEKYMAGMILRYEYVHGDPASRGTALELLREKASALQDEDMLLSLAVVGFMDSRTPEHLKRVCELLLAQGTYGLGLTAGLLLPNSLRPVPELITAATEEGWVETVRSLTALLPAKERLFRQGFDAARAGDFSRAEDLWSLGKGKTLGFYKALRTGRDIAARLYSGQVGEKVQALHDWEIWTAAYPGPAIWQKSPDLVRSSSGMVRTRSLTSDLTTSWHLAGGKEPVVLDAWGPARLRLVVRPLHAPGSTAAQNGWLEIRDHKGSRMIPVTRNRPTQGMEVDNDSRLPGRALTEELVLGAGPQHLRLRSMSFPCLVRVEQLQPVYRIPVLPMLRPDTVRAACKGLPVEIPQPEISLVSWNDRLVVISDQGSEKNMYDEGWIWKTLGPGRSDPDAVDPAMTPRDPASEKISAPVSDPRRDLVETARELVFQAETHPDSRIGAEAALRQMTRDHPERSELRILRDRVGTSMTWERIPAESNAGSYAFPLAGWEPETPGLRARKALLPCLFPGEHVLSRPGNLVVDMYNLTTTRLLVEAFLGDFPWLPEMPLVFWHAIDGNPPAYMRLTREHPEMALELSIPAGEHVVRVGVDTLFTNQFVRIRIQEPGQGCSSFACSDPGWSENTARVYDVATPVYPARYRIMGPAWIRVDRRDVAFTPTDYRYFPQGIHDLVLEPPADRMEAFFRVFRRAAVKDDPVPPLEREVRIAYDQVPGPEVAVADPVVPLQAGFPDGDSPVNGEDGTWEMEGGYHFRRDVQEDSDGDGEQYVEMVATHRFFYEDLPGYLKTGLTPLRIRKDGGILSAIAEDFVYTPEFLPFSVGLGAQFQVQNPEGSSLDFPGTGKGDTEWSGLLRAGISQQRTLCPEIWHLPGARIFGRILSLENTDGYDPDDVDQDIFTPYKHDHRYGISLGDTLTWAPFADTRLFAGINVGSNEDFNLFSPDNIRARVGWKQLLGPVQTGMGLRHTHYFEDDDRSTDSDRTFVDIDLTWTRWTRDQDRWQVGVSGILDTDSGDWSSALVLRWLIGNSRKLRDFRRQETVFPAIKTWAIPPGHGEPVLEPDPRTCPELRTVPEVLVPSEEQQNTASEPGYVVQINSFRNPALAWKRHDGLSAAGFSTSVVRLRDSTGSLWFVVQMGPFDTRAQAMKGVERIRTVSVSPVLIKCIDREFLMLKTLSHPPRNEDRS